MKLKPSRYKPTVRPETEIHKQRQASLKQHFLRRDAIRYPGGWKLPEPGHR